MRKLHCTIERVELPRYENHTTYRITIKEIPEWDNVSIIPHGSKNVIQLLTLVLKRDILVNEKTLIKSHSIEEVSPGKMFLTLYTGEASGEDDEIEKTFMS